MRSSVIPAGSLCAVSDDRLSHHRKKRSTKFQDPMTQPQQNKQYGMHGSHGCAIRFW